MANDQERGSPRDLGQDPFVERRRPYPSQPPEDVRILEGFLGDSDREGYKRLYFTRELDYYVEFRQEDVLFSEPIPPDQLPFLGQQATRVDIRREATIEYTRVRTPRPVDEFDLDVRLAGPRAGARLWTNSVHICCTNDAGTGCPGTQGEFTCQGETCEGTCQGVTCDRTCQGVTCDRTCGNTCPATCGNTCGDTCQNTCPATCGNTCGNTCNTCGNTCGCGPTEVRTCDGGCGETEVRTCINTRCWTCRC